MVPTMKAFPLQMGITPQGTIILTQANDEDGQEHVIILAPGQIEMLVSSLRIAAEALQATKQLASSPASST